MKKARKRVTPSGKAGKHSLGVQLCFHLRSFGFGYESIPVVGTKVQNIPINGDNTEEKENVFLFMNVRILPIRL